MGTAVGMWEAYRHGRVVLTISPLEHNWAVKFLSNQIYENLDSFETALQGGRVATAIEQARNEIAQQN